MRRDAWRGYLDIALGVTEASAKSAAQAVRKMVGQGGLTTEQVQGLADELLRASEANREAFVKMIRSETEKTLGALGLVRAEEVDRLSARVRELESQLKTGGDTAPAPTDDQVLKAVGEAAASAREERAEVEAAVSTDKPAAEPGGETAKTVDAPAKAAPRKVAKKAVAKKAVAKKAPAKKATAPAEPAAPVKKATKAAGNGSGAGS